MNIFVLLVWSTNKILASWRQNCFHFVNLEWKKKILRVHSEDLLIFAFDWLAWASEQNYEKVKANFVTLLKQMFDIFCDCSYDLTYRHTIFHYFSWISIWYDGILCENQKT